MTRISSSFLIFKGDWREGRDNFLYLQRNQNQKWNTKEEHLCLVLEVECNYTRKTSLYLWIREGENAYGSFGGIDIRAQNSSKLKVDFLWVWCQECPSNRSAGDAQENRGNCFIYFNQHFHEFIQNAGGPLKHSISVEDGENFSTVKGHHD